MLVPITPELLSICKEIVEQDLSLDTWSEIESDDLFQTDSLVGGFDATEQCFLFSWYAESGKEYSFDLSLEIATAIASGSMIDIAGRPANNTSK